MGRIVVVAEKPSVGRDIARVLKCTQRGTGCLFNEQYTVTWAVGHLATLCEPDELDPKYQKWRAEDLPILPEQIPLKVISATKDQFGVVKSLINDRETDSLICATDAGREGELIFRYIYEKAGCHKPFQRLWINSMTDEAIRDGFRNIRSGASYDGLYRSALCRSHADWLVGMNATRAFTLRYGPLLSVGRVQTPTLALLVKRRQEIEAFRPEKYCTLTADFGDYTGQWFREGQENETHLPDAARAKEIAEKVKGKTAAVRSAETVRKQDAPPQLYDLTSLQRDANSQLGFTAKKTLQLAQDLYEKHKALTYPRTDSRYLPPDMIPRVTETMHRLPAAYQRFVQLALPDGKLHVTGRTVDASKVTDHHALIPTNRTINPDTLTEDERQLYDLVARRMLQAFCPPCVYDATKVVTEAEGETFRSTGRTVLSQGWKEIPTLGNPPKKRKSKKEEEASLPPLQAGDTRTVKKTDIKEESTKPPAQHTDASLLAAMETAGKESDDEEIQRQMKGSGIGTPATRAAIIERLLQVGYAERKGKSLTATDKGVQLIAIMPQEIASAEMTGRWELALDQITDGKQDPERFMEGIRRFSAFLTQYARENKQAAAFPEEEIRGKGRRAMPTVKDAVCPVCGGKLRESPRAFNCTGSGCHFTLWKDGLQRGGGPELTEKLLRLLLEKRTLQGSTGTIMLTPDRIRFYPNGTEMPSVDVSVQYVKK